MDKAFVTDLIARWAKQESKLVLLEDKLDALKRISSELMAELQHEFSQATEDDLDVEFIKSVKFAIGKAITHPATWEYICQPKNKGGRGKKNTSDQDAIKEERRSVQRHVKKIYDRLREDAESRLPVMNAEETIFSELQEPSDEGNGQSSNLGQSSSRSSAPALEISERPKRVSRKPKEIYVPKPPAPKASAVQGRSAYVDLTIAVDEFQAVYDLADKFEAEVAQAQVWANGLANFLSKIGDKRKEWWIDAVDDNQTKTRFFGVKPEFITNGCFPDHKLGPSAHRSLPVQDAIRDEA